MNVKMETLVRILDLIAEHRKQKILKRLNREAKDAVRIATFSVRKDTVRFIRETEEQCHEVV